MQDEDVIESTAIVVRETVAPAEWTPSFVRTVDDQLAMLAERDRFYQHVLKPNLHYGIIPGTVKPSLWKPGAEALLSAMALHAETGDETPPVLDVMGREHDGEPFIEYRRFCRIFRQTGPTVSDRIEIAKMSGACNSWEPKYRYRNANRVCPQCGKEAIIKGKEEYGGGWVCFKKKDGCGAKFKDGDESIEGQAAGKVANENVLELQNTILKMADKRALIAATLVATGCSDIFTQDVEDMPATVKQAAPVGTADEAFARADKRAAETEAAEAEKKAEAAAVERAKRDRVFDAITDSCGRHKISADQLSLICTTVTEKQPDPEWLTLPELRSVRAALKAFIATKQPHTDENVQAWCDAFRIEKADENWSEVPI